MKVRGPVIAAVVAHARDERPNECCGLLLGSSGLVDESVPARNERLSPTRFLVHAQDHLRALRLARSTGRQVVGAYHSHPRGPSAPSETDGAELNDPSLLYVIVSLASEPPDVLAYEWLDGAFRPVPIVVVE